MKLKQLFTATAAAVLTTLSLNSYAMPVGDVTDGGIFGNSVDIGDAWSTNNGFGIDFWSIEVSENTQLLLEILGASYDFGISVYEGNADTDFLGSFDNDADYETDFGANYYTFVAGTSDLFGPFNSLDVMLESAGSYSIAVGGVNGVFGSEYQLSVEVDSPAAVSTPATGVLAATALGLLGLRRRRDNANK